jgi:Spy/CpxP family protein refolding chaperone
MRRVLFAILLGAAAAPGARAQTPSPASGPRSGEDMLARLLFPPELVIQHSQEIGLQPAQRTTIVGALKEMQNDMVDLQLQMSERGQEMAKLLGEPKVDEAAALAQVDKVLTLEREVKRRQMQLLIRIKNALTPEQQERLAKLRDRGGDRPE